MRKMKDRNIMTHSKTKNLFMISNENERLQKNYAEQKVELYCSYLFFCYRYDHYVCIVQFRAHELGAPSLCSVGKVDFSCAFVYVFYNIAIAFGMKVLNKLNLIFFHVFLLLKVPQGSFFSSSFFFLESVLKIVLVIQHYPYL